MMHSICKDHAIPIEKQHGFVNEPCMEFTWNMNGPCLEAHGLPTRVHFITWLKSVKLRQQAEK